MKKVISFFMTVIVLLACCSSVQAVGIKNQDEMLEMLAHSKDEKVLKRYDEIRKYGKLVKSDKKYIEITESLINGEVKDIKEYSPLEYQLKKMNNDINYSFGYGEKVKSWMELKINIYDMSFKNKNEISVTASFNWLKTPLNQLTDFISIGSTEGLIMASNPEMDEVSFTYFPDGNNYNVTKTYRGDRNRDMFPLDDVNGMAAKFPVYPNSLKGEMLNAGIATIGSQYSGSRITKSPKGILTFPAWRTGPGFDVANIEISYGHSMAGLHFNPRVEVDTKGNITYPSIGIDKFVSEAEMRITYHFEK